MKKHLLILFSAAILLTGCAVTRHLDNADRAINSGDWLRAKTQLESALKKKPSLLDKPEFVKKLDQVRIEATLIEAKLAIRRKQWANAINKLTMLLEMDPVHDEAQILLKQCGQYAADDFYAKARLFADQGDREKTLELLEKALSYNPDHEKAGTAAYSLNAPAAALSPESRELFERAERFHKRKKWNDAEAVYRQLIKREPAHHFSRIRLHAVRDIMEKTTEILNNADSLFKTKQLERCRKQLDRAFALSPHNDRAIALQKKLNKLFEQIKTFMKNARLLSDDNHFVDARNSLQAALTRFPGNDEAIQFRRELNNRAASFFTAQGNTYINNEKLDEAKQKYRTALDFHGAFTAALQGLGNIDQKRAEQAEKENLPGLALLYYMRGNDFYPTDQRHQQALKLKNKLIHTLESPAYLTLTGGGISEFEFARILETQLDSRLKPPLVRKNALTEKSKEIRLRLSGPAISTELIASRNRVHTYYVDVSIPNPDLPDLKNRVFICERDAHNKHRTYLTLWNNYQTAKSTADPNNPNTPSYLASLKQKAERAQREWNDAEYDYKKAKRKLERAPATVTVQRKKNWNYTVKTYKKTGRMTIRFDIAESSLSAQTVSKKIDRDDTEIINPNPSIGLKSDNLEFPSDRWYRENLLKNTADEAAQTIHRMLVEDAVATLNYKKLQVQNNNEKRELSVKIALFTDQLNPRKASAMVQILKNNLK